MPVYIPTRPEHEEELVKKEEIYKKHNIYGFSGKREVIKEYIVEDGFTTKNAGFSRWGFANKDGKEFFIKEFLSPVFPDSPEISKDLKNKKTEICRKWYIDRLNVFKAISTVATGNIVIVRDFFKFGNKFYQVTDKVSGSLSIDKIAKLSLKNKVLLLKVLAYSMEQLDKIKVVHADLKADNIIVKKTVSGIYTAKIIDISDSYFESNQPKSGDDVKGDFVYLAPESFLRMIDKDVKLTTKIDVFALGIIFHQYMCGKLPEISSDYHYIYEAVLNDETPVLDAGIPIEIRNIIDKMLIKEPQYRIPIDEVFKELSYLQFESKEPTVTNGITMNAGRYKKDR